MIMPDQTILHGITLKGVWLAKALREMERPEVEALYRELCERLADGTLHVPVAATYGREENRSSRARCEVRHADW